jgi:hypothetical protein
MSNFRARLFEEHSALSLKVQKLEKFICSKDYDALPEVERKDLKEQLGYMHDYLGVIFRRVSRSCG